ncbi:MAG TPA: hypothetical protein VEX40_00145 [Mycobacterium sp.]|nr:hypothetical protein [Mycobacterium sp.]
MRAQITHFGITADPDPYGVAVADDGAVWVPMVYSADAVARLNTAGAGTVDELPTTGAAPVGITRGDGALWCTEIGAGQIGRVDPDGGVDGCWFTEWAVNRVGPHRLVG